MNCPECHEELELMTPMNIYVCVSCDYAETGELHHQRALDHEDWETQQTHVDAAVELLQEPDRVDPDMRRWPRIPVEFPQHGVQAIPVQTEAVGEQLVQQIRNYVHDGHGPLTREQVELLREHIFHHPGEPFDVVTEVPDPRLAAARIVDNHIEDARYTMDP